MNPPKATLDEVIAEIGRIDPSIAARFAPPASENEIIHLEGIVGRTLPEEAKAIYRLHNGQRAGEWAWTIYHHYLMSIREAIDTLAMYRGAWAEFGATGQDAWLDEPTDPRTPGLYSPWRVPFLHDDTGNYVGYDLEPGPAGTYGQVVVFGGDVNPQVVCASIGELWGALLHELRAGNWILSDDGDGNLILDFKRKDSPVARLLSL